MKTKVGWLWFFVSLALAALLVAQYTGGRKTQVRLEKLQIQVEKMSAEARAQEAAVEKLRQERDQLRSEIATAPRVDAPRPTAVISPPPAAAPTPPAAAQSQASGRGGMFGDLFKDPEMRKAMAQQQRVGLEMAYGTLFKQLELTPEEQEKFKDLLIEGSMANMAQAGAVLQGENSQETTKQLAQEQQARDQQLKALIGDEKFESYQEYNQTMSERMALDQFGKGIQATPEQTEQLLSIIREEKQNAQINFGMATPQPQDVQAMFGSTEAVDRMLAQQEQVNARVVERAGGVLSAEQVRQLGPVLDTQLQMQRASMKMAREMFKNQAPAPEP
jgi:hypothetical protein